MHNDSMYVTYGGRRMLRVRGGDGTEDPATAPPAPEPPAAQPPAAPVAPPVQPPAEPAPATTPWADKLETRFEDPATRAAVDEFLRTDVQPYVTKLEQGAPQVDEGLQEFWKDLQQDPATAYAQLTGELFDEDAAQVVINALQAHYGEEPPEAGPPLPNADPSAPQPGDPEWEQVKNIVLTKQMEEDYNEELARIKADPQMKDVKLGDKDKWFHPFVVANDGDFDAAAAEYREWYAQITAELGGEPNPNDDPPPPEPPPAPTGGSTPPAPPVAQDYGGDIGAAIDDFFDDQRAAAPPPVGAS